MEREKRLVIEDLSPSESKNYFGAHAWNLTWIKGTVLEIIEDGFNFTKIRSLPNGRILTVNTNELLVKTEPV